MTAVPINETLTVIKGLDLSNAELNKAIEENNMLLIDVETSNVCNLNCRYCFRDVSPVRILLERKKNYDYI